MPSFTAISVPCKILRFSGKTIFKQDLHWKALAFANGFSLNRPASNELHDFAVFSLPVMTAFSSFQYKQAARLEPVECQRLAGKI